MQHAHFCLEKYIYMERERDVAYTNAMYTHTYVYMDIISFQYTYTHIYTYEYIYVERYIERERACCLSIIYREILLVCRNSGHRLGHQSGSDESS